MPRDRQVGDDRIEDPAVREQPEAAGERLGEADEPLARLRREVHHIRKLADLRERRRDRRRRREQGGQVGQAVRVELVQLGNGNSSVTWAGIPSSQTGMYCCPG